MSGTKPKTEPLALSTLAWSKISPQTRKKINSPIKREAQIDEDKYKKAFKVWRNKFIKEEDKVPIRDGKLMTKKSKIDGILRWIVKNQETGDYYRRRNGEPERNFKTTEALLTQILMSLRDKPGEPTALGPRGKYLQSRDMFNGGRWTMLYMDWIKSMSKEELQKFVIGYFYRNFYSLELKEFTNHFLQYYHWDDYMKNPEFQQRDIVFDEDGEEHEAVNHFGEPVFRHMDLELFDYERDPWYPWFIESFVNQLSSDELSNLYNNLYFESNMNNGVAPKEDQRFINNRRYNKPKFVVDGSITRRGGITKNRRKSRRREVRSKKYNK